MRRQLFAAALSCFGSSLFGQTVISPANQPQGAPNNAQNTLQNGLQGAQDAVDRSVPQSSGTTVLENSPNRSSLNTQGQVNGVPGVSGNAGVQSDANLQNNFNRQPGQLNSNPSTQLQGQPGVWTQQSGNNVPQNTFDQQRNTFQANGNNGSQSQQRQGQPIQAGQSQNAGPVYMLRFDASGREFICVNGRPIYFDNVNSTSSQGNSGNQNQYQNQYQNQNQNQNQYRSGYGSYNGNNGNNGDNSRDRSSNVYPSTIQPPIGTSQNPLGGNTNSRTVDPANSQRATIDSDLASPARDRLDIEKQNEINARQNDTQTKSNLDGRSDGVKASDSLNVPIEPKS